MVEQIFIRRGECAFMSAFVGLLLGILDDNKMVDVALRKLIFLIIFIRMSDYGVGIEADFHEYVRNCF